MSDTDQEQGETESAQSRYWLTNDYLSGILVGTLCLLILLNATPWVSIRPVMIQAFTAYVGVAVVWLFGKGAAKMILQGGD